MKINENCIKAVKAYLERTLEIEVDERDVRELVELYLRKWEYLFKFQFDIIVYKYLSKLDLLARVIKFSKIAAKVRKENPLAKIKAIIAYYHEDYDTLADEIANLLS